MFLCRETCGKGLSPPAPPKARPWYTRPMAIYHLTTKIGSRGGGQSAAAKAAYVLREDRYAGDASEVEHSESGNMPEWADDDPRSYWAAADDHERANGRLFREIEFALPAELGEPARRKLAHDFAQSLTARERLPYTLAIHRGHGSRNPHCHLVVSERGNDGIARTPETWFKRYNGQNPERGGARKSTATKPREWLEDTRESWADHANRALARAGRSERIDHRSHEDRYFDAVESGDEREAKRLQDNPPGVHFGRAGWMAARGIRTERISRALDVVSYKTLTAGMQRVFARLQEVKKELESLPPEPKRTPDRTPDQKIDWGTPG